MIRRVQWNDFSVNSDVDWIKCNFYYKFKWWFSYYFSLFFVKIILDYYIDYVNANWNFIEKAVSNQKIEKPGNGKKWNEWNKLEGCVCVNKEKLAKNEKKIQFRRNEIDGFGCVLLLRFTWAIISEWIYTNSQVSRRTKRRIPTTIIITIEKRIVLIRYLFHNYFCGIDIVVECMKFYPINSLHPSSTIDI